MPELEACVVQERLGSPDGLCPNATREDTILVKTARATDIKNGGGRVTEDTDWILAIDIKKEDSRNTLRIPSP